jgi:hypothetical protein
LGTDCTSDRLEYGRSHGNSFFLHPLLGCLLGLVYTGVTVFVKKKRNPGQEDEKRKILEEEDMKKNKQKKKLPSMLNPRTPNMVCMQN